MQRAARRAFLVLMLLTTPLPAAADDGRAVDVIRTWYRLGLELVRHTPTYSPPVASRAFAYIGVTAHEAFASGDDALVTLAGQLNGLEPVPDRAADATYDEAALLQAALSAVVAELFGNTGPTGQRAVAAITARLDERVAAGLDADVAARSTAYGRSLAAHVLAWSRDDGGAVVENMGFPLSYVPKDGPQHWVPTSLIAQQQAPLLPGWGDHRTFAMPDGRACGLPPPPDYSEAAGSAFHDEAMEVYRAVNTLTEEERAIARFWSDDPMLSPTPPGHWISIAMQALASEDATGRETAELLARLGIGLADAFIGCWEEKYEYDLVRPVTYIRRLIDPDWEPILITPPFPEYPSGHSTQSGAAAVILTDHFGPAYSFEDATHESDGIPPRRYGSFWEAAEEAGISRLYGGIHYRAAIERGLDQGRCIGAYVSALVTRRQP